MSKTKILIRFCGPCDTLWYLDVVQSNSMREGENIEQAYDFAQGRDQIDIVATEAYATANRYRVNLDYEIEIVMIRDGVETIIDPSNGMQMLALAVME